LIPKAFEVQTSEFFGSLHFERLFTSAKTNKGNCRCGRREFQQEVTE
jgi:hypothetical protein